MLRRRHLKEAKLAPEMERGKRGMEEGWRGSEEIAPATEGKEEGAGCLGT